MIPKVLDQVDFGSGLLRANARSALAGDFQPFFYLKHMLKDAHLVADLARDLGVPVVGVPAAIASLTAAANAGYADDNVSALVAWLQGGQPDPGMSETRPAVARQPRPAACYFLITRVETSNGTFRKSPFGPSMTRSPRWKSVATMRLWRSPARRG